MPTGQTIMHPTMGSLFIFSDESRWYQSRTEELPPPGARVSFEVDNITGAPPGFLFAKRIVVLPAQPPSGQAPVTNALPTRPASPWGAVGGGVPKSITATPVPSQPTTPKPAVSPALPTQNVQAPRTLTNRQTREDFQFIVNKVNEMADKNLWAALEKHGGSVQVQTRLRWEGEGIQLYLRVKEEYHDKRIPGTNLYFFVGTMGVNFGKGGFRISAHTQPKAQIAKAKTRAVLHVEN
ncbi:MAG TPA: hypothetical protein VF048_04865 [Gemmatimonadaceae bacterium]|jgi:hypothetical protein